jgi:hypothetical protein
LGLGASEQTLIKVRGKNNHMFGKNHTEEARKRMKKKR